MTTPASAPLSRSESVRYASTKLVREWLGGIDLRVEQHVLPMFPAALTTAQVKSARKRAVLGPHPWRPPE
jgi:hypothetical protein